MIAEIKSVLRARRSNGQMKAVYADHLDAVCLRERAISAREKAEGLQRMARHVKDTGAAQNLMGEAAQFEDRAASLDREREELEDRLTR
jgi:hypothetical protein